MGVILATAVSQVGGGTSPLSYGAERLRQETVTHKINTKESAQHVDHPTPHCHHVDIIRVIHGATHQVSFPEGSHFIENSPYQDAINLKTPTKNDNNM